MASSTYRFTTKPLVHAYEGPSGRKKVATIFLGEWVKLHRGKASDGRVRVSYRGGSGWVNEDDLGQERMLEVFFLDVGQGDSILIQTPADRRILIDGGPDGSAHQFITNKYRLDKPDNYIDFDAVIATHLDADHADGLAPILADPKIGIRAFYHNGLFPGQFERRDTDGGKRAVGLRDEPGATDALPSHLHTLVDALAAAKRNLRPAIRSMRTGGRDVRDAAKTECRRLDAAMAPLEALEGCGVGLKVLWPAASGVGESATYPWYNGEGRTANGNSVVLKVTNGRRSLLLAGDLNERSMEDLAERYSADELRADVYKAAHHGSQDFSLSFLKKVRPDAAVVSAGDDARDKHGHPRAVLMGTIARYSVCERPAVFCTELAACFSPLRGADLESFRSGSGQLYEKAIEGVIHLRCDGEQLYLGTVHGRRPPAQPMANTTWRWDVWPDRSPSSR